MTNEVKEKLILKNMENLDISREEAEELVNDDERIDKGERLDWEPSIEEEKAMRKATKVKVHRTRASGTPRTKAPDLVKAEVIETIFKALSNEHENVTIVNKECQIDFSVGDENFTIKLTKHRKK